ncbi:MAG: hypothetical protein WCT17_02815 [Bacilli bacterium]
MDNQRFLNIVATLQVQDQTSRGIGTYQEKLLHRALKYYFEPNEEFHEVKVDPYIADIFNGRSIIEIQTGNFNKIRDKLTAFCSSYPVLLVYPMAHQKWIRWEEDATGELNDRRKSPKVGSVYDFFKELYKIKWFLSHPNLTCCIILLDLEETRLLNGWSRDHKKGSSRKERFPIQLINEVYFDTAEDYQLLIPSSLSGSFTVRDFSTSTKLTLRRSQEAISVLKELNLIYQDGKLGRAYTYCRGKKTTG